MVAIPSLIPGTTIPSDAMYRGLRRSPSRRPRTARLHSKGLAGVDSAADPTSGAPLGTKPRIQLEALHVLARALAGGEFRARAILERACAAVAEGFAFERVGIVRYVAETSMLLPFAGHGLTPAELGAIPSSLPIGAFAAFERTLASGEACYVPDPAGENVPPLLVERFGLGSFVIVPLVSEGRCLGFMTCDERGETFSLDRSELDLLTTIGTLVAAFLERAIAQGELRRLNELKSQFAALASHELRTPVAAIYGAAKTLDALGDELSPEQQADLRRLLSSQSQRLLELVENLLDLSRLEADAIRIEPARLPVAERLREIVGAVFDGDSKGAVVDAREDLHAVVDPHAFDRIVSNLVANAQRHGAPPVRVSAVLDDGRLRVTVEDRGEGVSADFVGSLFERFTRGPTGSSVGAGLGLSIAQTYARAHGGTLGYVPADPHGARFEVVLPAGVD
ncbi:MAG: ATP-binding protein [Solirubrobacteraceae bacterium]